MNEADAEFGSADVRPATRADLPRIVEIYNAAIPGRLATADTVPVALESRLGWFTDRDMTRRPVLVHQSGRAVGGWASFEDFKKRPAYHATAELSIYVAPEFQQRGIGGALLTACIRRAPLCGVRSLLAVIFAHNEPSLRLFRSRGFAEWGTLPDIADLDGTERSVKILGLRIPSGDLEKGAGG